MSSPITSEVLWAAIAPALGIDLGTANQVNYVDIVLAPNEPVMVHIGIVADDSLLTLRWPRLSADQIDVFDNSPIEDAE